MIALDINELTYSYKSNWTFASRRALEPYSLSIPEGESFGFLGHNGAGKTTTIKCILNLINPTGGEIRIFGKNSTDPSSRLAVGYIPEQPYFYDNLSVEELLRLYGRLAGIQGAELRSRVAECIERVGLSERSSSRLRSLSKGLMQRVALAQAILNSPRLLILDEPFSGLDPLGRKQFRDIFHELNRNGTTLFISSHVLPDVEFLCTRVSIMAKGNLRGVFGIRDIPRLSGGHYELLIRGEREILQKLSFRASKVVPIEDTVRLEFKQKEVAEEALSDALAQKVMVESYQFVQGGLEELFVKIVEGGSHEG